MPDVLIVNVRVLEVPFALTGRKPLPGTRCPSIIKWNEAGRVVEFKVMIRPLKAINLIHQRMAAMLQAGR